MSAAHTPGEWIFTPGLNYYGGENCGDMAGTIEAVEDETFSRWHVALVIGDLVDSESNARLIAAAPTMFGYIETMAALGDMDAIKIMDGLNATTAVEPNSVGTPQGVNQND